MGTWAGAIATVLVRITTALAALGYFDGLQGPRLRLTFEATEPWCRQGRTEGDGTALWVRVGVENLGAGPAWRRLGRLISQRNHQRRGAARCGSGAAVLGRRANDPVLIAEATLMEALLGN